MSSITTFGFVAADASDTTHEREIVEKYIIALIKIIKCIVGHKKISYFS